MSTLHLVVGYDSSDLGKKALTHALAVAHGAVQAEVLVLKALGIPAAERGEGISLATSDALIESERKALLADVMDFAPEKHVVCRAEVRFGEAAEVLCEAARETDADFVFVGTHGRTGLQRMLVGSVAERTVRLAPCTVIVVRSKASDLEPKIEPACPDCTKVKAESGNANLWCERHSHHKSHPPHLHYKYPEHFARGSMNLRFDD